MFEDDVVKIVSKQLRRRGWKVTQTCYGRQHGMDILARRGRQSLAIECKGSKGQAPGTKKDSFSSSQIHTHFGVALCRLLIEEARSKPGLHLCIAQPDSLRDTLRDAVSTIASHGFSVLWVSKNGRIDVEGARVNL